MRSSINLIPETAVTEMVELAVRAESAGFDRCWVYDEGLVTRDVHVTMAALAAATTARLGVGDDERAAKTARLGVGDDDDARTDGWPANRQRVPPPSSRTTTAGTQRAVERAPVGTTATTGRGRQ